jgi:mannose-6-phosphate isomerase-like protein (cupin superfamily)
MLIHPSPQSEFYTSERCFITEILNAGDMPNVSLARARVEPQVTTQRHALPVDEIYYILEGTGMMEVGAAAASEVNKGDAVYIKAGQAQRITNTGDSDLVFLCICSPRFTPDGYQALED